MGRRGKCSSDESLLDCARRLGVGITCICGGVGKCRSCKVKILKGHVSAPTATELEVFSSRELQDGCRLACRTYPTTDCKLDVPPGSMTSPQRVRAEGLEIEIAPQPTVQAFHVKLAAPSLSDPRADDGRLLEAINRQHQLQFIGMLPPLPLKCFRQVGNAAGMGAKLALISSSIRTETQTMASEVNYIELAGTSRFKQTFLQACSLGKYWITDGRRKETI